MCKMYDSTNIKILKGLDAVKKRPGMYIGNTEDGTGYHHMIFEVIDNSIDEVLSNNCNEINVKIYKDNSVSVNDNGRGIPIDIHKEYNKSSAELIMTMLHAGAKFDNDAYKISGGLHGVGISVVNALSKKLDLIIYRNGNTYKQTYEYGKPKNELSIVDKTDNTGTFIRFWPDLNVFTDNNYFKYEIIYERLQELSFLNSNVNLTLEDERTNKKHNFNNLGGLKSFIKYLLLNKNLIHQNYFYFNTEKNNINIEVILQWTNSFKEFFYCFTNNIKQKDGGSHLSGLKSAITKTINNYIEKEISKKLKTNIVGDDTREGLVSIISIKFFNPKFSSQTKDKLISSEIKSFVENIVSEKLMEFLVENPIDSKNIINKIIQSSLTRDSAKKAREIIRKKGQIEFNNLIGKLSDCQEKNPNLSELYLVEGDSAGGSAKQARNRKNQAVLSLKGKIINVEKSSLDKVLLSQEILNLITAIGCGIEKNDYNINKLKYFKIIIMTDADVDGSHIRTLLLTFFYRHIPELIKRGHLYIAQPPLYKIIYKNRNEKYIKNDNEFLEYKILFVLDNIYEYYKNFEKINRNIIKEIIMYYIKIKNIIYNLSNKIPKIFLFTLISFNKKLYIEELKNFNYIHDYFKNLIEKINKNFDFIKYNFEIIEEENKCFKIILKEFNYGININYIIDEIFIKSEEYKNIINFSSFILKNTNIDEGKNIINFFEKIDFLLNEYTKNLIIHRYKGLGEMNPNQLWNTTMNPVNRNLVQIKIKDENLSNKLFNILMGESVDERKKFIEQNYIYAKNIDI